MADDLGEADEVFHPAGDDVDWNESGWFGFNVPDRDINGFLYYFHDVRTGVSGGGPALWDPSGQEVYDCLFYDWRWRQPPTGRLEFRDFRLPNSLRHEVIEPMQRYRLSYSELGLELNLEWTALMKPHVLGLVSTEHCHFDQPGRMRGTVTLQDENFDVDCYSMRDRTWGPHRPGARRSGDYLWAIAGSHAHWHAITMASRNPGVDRVIGGYLVRDGQLGEMVAGERRVLERRSGAPVRVELDAEDNRGRTLHAEGEVRTALRWLGWPGRLTFWTLTHWTWDGVTGYGENQEFFAREQVRALIG
jgi:predicted phosphatase